MKVIPTLMITHNRLDYTKKALRSLIDSDCGWICVIDNASTDGTTQWLMSSEVRDEIELITNRINIGIAGAMNQFLRITKNYYTVGKVDNDTIVPKDFFNRMSPHMQKADIIQAKHKLIDASGVGTFDQWTSKMPSDGPLRFNHFVGGSGILFKRSLVDRLPETNNKLMGWREWQRQHPEVKKAFVTDVEIELLDEKGYPEEYKDYYKSTGRIV